MGSDNDRKPMLVIGQLNLYWGSNLAHALHVLRSRGSLDVLCLQEVYEEDLESISEALNLPFSTFSCMGEHLPTGEQVGLYRGGTTGIALLSAAPFQVVRDHDLGHFHDDPKWVWWQQFKGIPLKNMLLTATRDFAGRSIKIATTHGAWGPNAANETLQHQRVQLSMIHTVLGFGSKDTILAADFNRRCGHMEESGLIELAPEFASALPPGTRTTIDQSHRAIQAGNDFEVPVDDICYTFESLTCQRTELVPGLSDHLYVESVFGWKD